MKPEDIDILIDQHFDEVEVTEGSARDNFEQLKGLLTEDETARQQYVESCVIRQDLSDKYAFSETETYPADTDTCLVNLLDNPNEPDLGSRWKPSMSLLAVLAATLLIGFFIRSSPTLEAPSENSLAASPAFIDPDIPDPIGTIERKINCVWTDEAWKVDPSGQIPAGHTISLERGFMSLHLKNGVRVALEAPVEFTVTDDLHGVLEYGGIGVRVPEGFSGYVVDTPTARVIDLGTEFSVKVGRHGRTDLHVIDGEVTVSQRDRSGELSDQEPALLTKDAVWNSVAGLRVPIGPPSNTDFPRISLLEDPTPLSVPDLDITDDLLLWLSADTAVKTDAQNRVIAWGDLSSLENNVDRHSAWQVDGKRRPKLILDGLAGKPAIRFDGYNDCLITEPLPNGDAQTIAVAMRFRQLIGKGRYLPAQQIINYNGPPHLVLEYRWPSSALRGRAFGGYVSKPEQTGKVAARPIKAGETLFIVYTYDHINNVAELFLNGESQGTNVALLPVATKRPKVIGLHRRLTNGGLFGDIAELMIYDHALSQEETEKLNLYLQDRYADQTIN